MVLGHGGREHALVRALSKNSKVYAWPGNDGMSLEAICAGGNLSDHKAIAEYVKKEAIDLVVVGPDQALADGVVDYLEAQKILTFGPRKNAARMEWSKVFSKEFMNAAGLPTAHHKIVKSVDDVEKNFSEFTPPYVLKADGLALGKGVFICKTKEDLLSAARDIFENKTLGAAGSLALLEQFTSGWELSIHILTNGRGYELFPGAQDHKRLLENDEGPNTGGMGAVAPVPISPVLMKQIRSTVLDPLIRHMQDVKLDYRGLLYVGLMINPKGPSVIEFNARFGDPEAQVFLPLMENDWALAFQAVARGQLPQLSWKNEAAACVVMAAEGYPDSPKKNVPITGDLAPQKNSYILHAGTKKVEDHFVTNGGRVLNIIGLGPDLESALNAAYTHSSKIGWPGHQIRMDIGKKIL